MGEYVITGPDGKKYKVSGDTPEGALAALRQFVGPIADDTNPDGTVGKPPEGMMLDPKTGAMVDTKARAEQAFGGPLGQVAAGAGRMASGFPILGGLLEQNAGMGDPIRQETVNQAFKQFDQANPYTSFGLQAGGAIAGTLPMVSAAPGWFGAGPGGLAMNSAKSLVSGAAVGGADALARGNDPAVGAVAGGAVGAAAPALVRGMQVGLDTVGGAVGIGNESRARQAISTALQRSGMSPDDVADGLQRAANAGQDMYTVADEMGLPGQRMLTGVYRTPGEARTKIHEQLISRQTGQGDRLTNFIAEGFGAPDTALARGATLDAARSATANTNYAAARQNAGPVDLSDVLDTIDTLTKRNPILGDTALTKTEMGSRLAALRGRMQNGGQQLIDFDTVMNVKEDLGRQIGAITKRGEKVPVELAKVYGELDSALEGASAGYRTANDTFRQQSKVIDAIDRGKAATSGRTRAPDNIQAFNTLSPEEKATFRVGYADPLIARIEATSSSPTTNKARPLLTPKAEQEFPAFASPGKAPQLMDRIAREQRMFETLNHVRGGSQTADNLADVGEIASVDPEVMASLLSGRFGTAATQLAGKAKDALGGRNTATRDLIARTLLETRSPAARKALAEALARTQTASVTQQAIMRALLQLGAQNAQ